MKCLIILSRAQCDVYHMMIIIIIIIINLQHNIWRICLEKLDMSWKIIFLSLFSVANSMSIGRIDNCSQIADMSVLVFNVTQDECICRMIHSNGSKFALNYFSTNRTCQLFESSVIWITLQFDVNSIFAFLNQSAISIRINRKLNKKRTHIILS